MVNTLRPCFCQTKKQRHVLKFDKSKEGLGGLGTNGSLLSMASNLINTMDGKHAKTNLCAEVSQVAMKLLS